MIDGVTTSDHPLVDGPALPSWLETGRRILLLIGRTELFLAATALSIVAIVSGAQAILRYTIGASLWWAQEVAQLTIILSYFFGVSYLFKIRQYILIEFVSMMMSIRIQLVLYIIAQILTIIFTGTVLVLLIRYAPALMRQTTPSLGLPEFIRSVPLAIASAMMVLTSIYYLAFGVWALLAGVSAKYLDDIEYMALIAAMPEDLD